MVCRSMKAIGRSSFTSPVSALASGDSTLTKSRFRSRPMAFGRSPTPPSGPFWVTRLVRAMRSFPSAL